MSSMEFQCLGEMVVVRSWLTGTPLFWATIFVRWTADGWLGLFRGVPYAITVTVAAEALKSVEKTWIRGLELRSSSKNSLGAQYLASALSIPKNHYSLVINRIPHPSFPSTLTPQLTEPKELTNFIYRPKNPLVPISFFPYSENLRISVFPLLFHSNPCTFVPGIVSYLTIIPSLLLTLSSEFCSGNTTLPNTNLSRGLHLFLPPTK